MKRDMQGKINSGLTLTAIALTGSGPVWAHPEVTGHVAVSGPAHGMVHAMMNAPALMAGVCLALGGLWLFLRLRRRTPAMLNQGCKPELTQE